ncbi:hypothetical protein ACOYR1_00525 [Thalassotalea piscium]
MMRAMYILLIRVIFVVMCGVTFEVGAIKFEKKHSIPLLIKEYRNPYYDELYRLISMQDRLNDVELVNMSRQVVDDISPRAKCHDAIFILLVKMLPGTDAVGRELPLFEVNPDCPNSLLLSAIEEKGSKGIFKAYQFIETIIEAETNLAENVEKKRYVNPEIKKMALSLYGNENFKVLLQTYILKTLFDNKEQINDASKLSLVVGFLVLAELYMHEGDLMKQRMILWTILPSLQDGAFLKSFIYRKESNIYLH